MLYVIYVCALCSEESHHDVSLVEGLLRRLLEQYREVSAASEALKMMLGGTMAERNFLMGKLSDVHELCAGGSVEPETAAAIKQVLE